MSARLRLAVVGTGPVARALIRGWADGGGEVSAVLSRDGPRAARCAAECGAQRGTSDPADARDADVVVVAVADRAVAGTGRRIGEAWGGSGPVVLHTSGVLPGAALSDARLRTGSLHPLQSFPAAPDDDGGGRRLAARLPGTHWFHEGEGLEVARNLVAGWSGTLHALAPGGKALYHAGAAILSNHAVALFADATRCLDRAGVPPAESRAALASLLEGTAANLRAAGVPSALTGPVARGDAATVRLHVEALRSALPEVLPAYVAMARRAVAVALEKGTLSAAGADEIGRALGG